MTRSEAERHECLEVVKEYLTAARFDPRRHLGLGDVRFTIGDEDQISAKIRARGE